MKENRKLLKEVIKGIKRDMTDEDVLNLLADSKVSENPNREKISTPSGSVLPMQLQSLQEAGHLFFVCRPPHSVDACERAACCESVRSLSVHFAEPCLIMCGSSSSSPHNDESEQAGRKGQAQSRKRL